MRPADPPAPPTAAEPLPGWRLGAVLFLLVAVPLAVTFSIGGLPEVRIFGFEPVLLPALVLLRLALSFRYRRRLLPLVDMPILGLLFVCTGGADSPLDPALFFVYALLAFALERAARRPVTLRHELDFLVGIALMYGILLVHVKIAQELDEAERVQALREQVTAATQPLAMPPLRRADLVPEYLALRRRIDLDRSRQPVIAAEPYFAPSAGVPDAVPGAATFDAAFEEYVAALEDRERALRELAPRLDPALPLANARAAAQRLHEAFGESDARIDLVLDGLHASLSRLVERIGAEGGAVDAPGADYRVLLTRLFDPLEVRRRTQASIRDEFLGVIDGLRELAAHRFQQRQVLKRLLSERLGMAILVVATLLLLGRLRAAFEREVERRETARAEAEVVARQRETENWIALTAGLTHTIGNDILAYDAYGGEALEALASAGSAVPEVVERNLRFIHESNKARLAFVRFLDEFARARKHALEDGAAAPRGLQPIAVEPLLREVRRRVGEVEVADLPRDVRDPAVAAQRRRFVDLPLEIRFASDEARTIAAGRRGVLEFFVYELLKNALRNASGERPLEAHVAKEDGRFRLRLVNDLAVERVPGEPPRYRLPRLAGMAPVDASELRRAVEEILAHAFEPGRGGGTGLGLFLIRYFAREYYAGSVRASILPGERLQVAFELDLPDDLAAARRTEAAT